MSLKREVHTQGIVVARRAAGEGSVRISILTEELGLVSALATSGREERSKLRPYLLVGTFGTFSLVKGKEVWRLTGVVRGRNSFYICTDILQQEAIARVLGLIRQFIHGESSDDGLFDAVWEYVRAAPALSAEESRIAEYVAALRILAALGYVAKSEDIHSFLGAEYTAALLAEARMRSRELVKKINDGIGASGL